MQEKRVLCVSSADWLGVCRLPRLLATAGFRVSLLAHPDHRAARSRHAHTLVQGSWNPAETIERLRLHLADGAAYDWILIADDPTMVEAVLRSREAWMKACLPVDSASNKPRLLTSKASFFEAAAVAGLPIPRTLSASCAEELRSAAKKLGFPVLIKPSEGVGGTGVFTAADASELESRIPPDGAFVVQSFIQGRSGGTASLFKDGRPVWWFSSLRERVWPEPYGPSCQRRIIHPPEIPAILEKVGAMLGLTGLIEIEWILPEGGGPVIIEMNPRPPPYVHLAEEMGSGVTLALGAFLAGAATVAPQMIDRDGEVVALFPEDAVRAASQRDWAACARWLSGRAGSIPWGDPGLLRSFAWLVAKSLLRPRRPGSKAAPTP